MHTRVRLRLRSQSLGREGSGTTLVTTLSPQLSYAQNASRGASTVNNQTAASKVTFAATATTPNNSTIGLNLGNIVYPLVRSFFVLSLEQVIDIYSLI